MMAQEVRNEQFNLRISPRERMRLEQMAASHKMNISEYIRAQAAYGAHQKRIEGTLAMLRELLKKWPENRWPDRRVWESLVDDTTSAVSLAEVTHSNGLSIDRAVRHLEDLATIMGIHLDTVVMPHPTWVQRQVREFETVARSRGKFPSELRAELGDLK